MPFIKSFEKIPALIIRKRLGLPNMCGWSIPGWSQCGDDNNYTGVYQQRRPRHFNSVTGKWEFGRQKNFWQMPAWPIQPASVARDAQQAKFVTALEMWQALTSEQKVAYNTIASRRGRRGYDYFMSKTLKSL